MNSNKVKLDRNTCPWWFIGAFDNPLRKLAHKPERILAGLVLPGQNVLDLGPGMGFFTIPLARMVGPTGTVVAADLQPQMLAGVRRRAEQAGVYDRIRLHVAQPERIGATGPFDFALSFWMLHEVRKPAVFLGEVFRVLKPGGRLLIAEPVLHVPAHQFHREVELAVQQGFRAEAGPAVRFSRSMLFLKDEQETTRR